MSTVIVLAMHGAPARDFPSRETGELFGLHGRVEHSAGAERVALVQRHAELEARMRAWPRTSSNDPYWAASFALASHLAHAAGMPVVVGFNEFCAPSLDEALDEAAGSRPERVIVVTPMMTRGGEHSEVDIPAAIQKARGRHAGIVFDYVWPFDPAEVAAFLAQQIAQRSR
jgi:sirohydrochlorin cobaltochelatase